MSGLLNFTPLGVDIVKVWPPHGKNWLAVSLEPKSLKLIVPSILKFVNDSEYKVTLVLNCSLGAKKVIVLPRIIMEEEIVEV